MTKKMGCALGALLVSLGLIAVVIISPRAEFTLGGALVNLGYRLQDRFSQFDFEHDETITPDQIWDELKRQNEMAAGVRGEVARRRRPDVGGVHAQRSPGGAASTRHFDVGRARGRERESIAS